MKLDSLDLASLNEKNKMHSAYKKKEKTLTFKSFTLRNHPCSTGESLVELVLSVFYFPN